MNLAAAYSLGRTTTANLIDPTSHLFAYYRFNNNIESEVNGYHGISSSGIGFVAGLNGGDKAISISQFGSVDVADSNIFSFTDGVSDIPVSISLSIKLKTVNTNNWVLSKRFNNSTRREWDLFISAANRVVFLLRDMDNNRISIGSSIDLTADIEYQIVVTYDGSGSENGFEIFINGIKDSSPSRNDNGGYSGTFDGDGVITLFNLFRASGEGLDGVADYLGFYNKQLIQEEVNFINHKTSQGAELI